MLVIAGVAGIEGEGKKKKPARETPPNSPAVVLTTACHASYAGKKRFNL